MSKSPYILAIDQGTSSTRAALIDKNGIIIVHRHKNEQDLIPKNFKIVEEKQYGISKIFFLISLN